MMHWDTEIKWGVLARVCRQGLSLYTQQRGKEVSPEGDLEIPTLGCCFSASPSGRVCLSLDHCIYWIEGDPPLGVVVALQKRFKQMSFLHSPAPPSPRQSYLLNLLTKEFPTCCLYHSVIFSLARVLWIFCIYHSTDSSSWATVEYSCPHERVRDMSKKGWASAMVWWGASWESRQWANDWERKWWDGAWRVIDSGCLVVWKEVSESTRLGGRGVWEARLTVRKTPLRYPWHTTGIYAVFSSVNAILKDLMSLKVFMYFYLKIFNIVRYN